MPLIYHDNFYTFEITRWFLHIVVKLCLGRNEWVFGQGCEGAGFVPLHY